MSFWNFDLALIYMFFKKKKTTLPSHYLGKQNFNYLKNDLSYSKMDTILGLKG